MKSLLTLFVTVAALFLVPLNLSANAQTNCAQILDIKASIDPITAREGFDCTVTVDNAHAGSRWIACGVTIDGVTQWPRNYCPSNTNFKGWNGSVAQFGCNIPNDPVITSGARVSLIAYDFHRECGPETGKSIAVTVRPASSSLPDISTTPDPSAPPDSEPSIAPPPPPPTYDTGYIDINTCTNYAAEDVLNRLRIQFGDEYVNDLRAYLENVCGRRSTGNTPPNVSITPFPSVPAGNGELYDLNEFLNPSIPSESFIKASVSNCVPQLPLYQSACRTMGYDSPICVGALAGIDRVENQCRSTHTCKDGRTRIGEPDPELGNKCDVTETIPGSPVKIGAGCGFTDREHALRWCVKHLKGQAEIFNGNDRPATMQEIILALARYNGLNYNANCKTGAGVSYSYCPPPLYGADNAYVMANYMCPAYQNHCKMYILNCSNCPRAAYIGTLTAARAFLELVNQQL